MSGRYEDQRPRHPGYSTRQQYAHQGEHLKGDGGYRAQQFSRPQLSGDLVQNQQRRGDREPRIIQQQQQKEQGQEQQEQMQQSSPSQQRPRAHDGPAPTPSTPFGSSFRGEAPPPRGPAAPSVRARAAHRAMQSRNELLARISRAPDLPALARLVAATPAERLRNALDILPKRCARVAWCAFMETTNEPTM